jgi:hypothetical protein
MDYVKGALATMKAKGLDTHPGFLGPSLWGFASEMSYPPHTQNLFTPGTPFVDAGEEEYLKTALF